MQSILVHENETKRRHDGRKKGKQKKSYRIYRLRSYRIRCAEAENEMY